MDRPPAPVVFADVHVLRNPPGGLPEAVTRIRRLTRGRDIPLVLCSARTRTELECLQQEFDMASPFVCENGAAAYVPEGYFGFPVPNAACVRGYEVVVFGRSYGEVVETLRRTARRLGIDVVGFSDLTIEEVAVQCGLTLPQARLAKMREYGEPFRIAGGDPLDRLRLFSALRKQGLGCTRGDQYDYVGAPVDEIAGIGLLCRCFERAFGPIVTIGVGDPSRDVRLLGHMQVPIVCRHEAADVEWIPKPRTAEFDVSAVSGGWRDVLRRLLTRSSGRVTAEPAPAIPPTDGSPDAEFWPIGEHDPSRVKPT